MIRPIRTIFYAGKDASEMVKKIAGSDPIRATGNAVMHMRRNTYKAMLAEVYSELTGKLYSVIVRELDGTTTVLYQAPLSREEKAALLVE